MAADLIIRNGTVVDGTGAPAVSADVAVAGGRIAEIGKLSGSAARVIDAGGLVVAPGFVDPHTHYDAQMWWDRDLSPSPWHGVTSVVMGNCGVGVAPCAPSGRDPAMYDLVNVEGIPYEVMRQGITWEWQSFPEFMDAAQRHGAAINRAFLAPLTPFRYHVMGEASMERPGTPEETARIASLIGEALRAGAAGVSTTILPNHIGHKGRPLACKLADRSELRAYARELRKAGKGIVQIALNRRTSVMDDEEYELVDFLMSESGARLTWSAVVYREDVPDACVTTLEKAAPLIRRGARVQMSALPMTREFNAGNPFTFSGYPSWHPLYNQSPAEQKAILRSAEFRGRFREELKGPGQFSGNWSMISVAEVASPALKRLEGRTIAQVAAERGVDGVDAIADLMIEDDLKTEFLSRILNNNPQRVGELLNDPRTLIGLGDAGAHVSALCDAGYPTYVLGTWVRERGTLSLEQAVKRMSSEPADFFGLRGRGRLAPGMAADIVVFDPGKVASVEPWEKRYDLPGGAKRIVTNSRGIEYTIVNGTPVYERGQMTGAMPGEVLRS